MPGRDGSLEDMIAAFDAHVGTPDEVIASLRADTHAGARDRSRRAGPFDRSAAPFILRSIELVAEEVAPALGWVRDACAAAPARPPSPDVDRTEQRISA